MEHNYTFYLCIHHHHYQTICIRIIYLVLILVLLSKYIPHGHENARRNDTRHDIIIPTPPSSNMFHEMVQTRHLLRHLSQQRPCMAQRPPLRPQIGSNMVCLSQDIIGRAHAVVNVIAFPEQVFHGGILYRHASHTTITTRRCRQQFLSFLGLSHPHSGLVNIRPQIRQDGLVALGNGGGMRRRGGPGHVLAHEFLQLGHASANVLLQNSFFVPRFTRIRVTAAAALP
jgi:hypothetical protein